MMTCNLTGLIGEASLVMIIISYCYYNYILHQQQVIDDAILPKPDGELEEHAHDCKLSHPLMVSQPVYDIVKDVFLKKKSFKAAKTSCVTLFTPYPSMIEEYPPLGLVTVE